MSKKRVTPEKPFCFKDPIVYRFESTICRNCPYFIPCGVSLKQKYNMTRREMETFMAKWRLPLAVAVEAVRAVFPVTENAVNLSYSRKLKKYGTNS